ncbi:MAG: T9SS type A sorting domain-containing protein, partial [Bacteroidales bacterium]|nr:T9SS type A sorting domain-containing protein [Bacteroidales bacterium]
LCVLPDATIGLYVEEAYAGASGYSTVFYNFSLEWLTDGNDTFDPTGIAENQIQTEPLKVYPVPASSFVTIEAEGMKMVSIYNALGQLVKSVLVNGASEVNLDVSEWVSGTYLVEGTDSNGLKKVGRFVR